MQKILITNPDLCTGCRVCELICSNTHNGEFNPKKAFIRILRNKDMDTNMITLKPGCDQCEECVKWCLPQALEFVNYRDALMKWKATKIGKIPAPILNNP